MASQEVESEAADVPRDRPILLFDGVCNLCNGVVQWVVERDPEGRFRFASLQSDAGEALLREFGRPTEDYDSFVLVDGDDHYTKSTAVLRVLRDLGFPYSLAWPLRYVPRVLRDAVYDAVAASRYSVFGKRDRCMIPDESMADRFVE